jgi:uracil-DNA glycosylase
LAKAQPMPQPVAPPSIPATLSEGWHAALADAFAAPSMATLKAFLVAEKAAGKRIFPPGRDWFRALELTSLETVKVVILGQDPYHGPGQAHGLCFSVAPGVRPPPSLGNIFKELRADVGFDPTGHGCLESWARQGVLLLNSVLTVEMAQAASHKGRGWEEFTDAVIRAVAAQGAPVVFLLWGSHAHKKAAFVEDIARGGRHLVLKAAHPSPLSAHNGFLGCRHFSKANAFLVSEGRDPINWTLPPL